MIILMQLTRLFASDEQDVSTTDLLKNGSMPFGKKSEVLIPIPDDPCDGVC